MNRLLCKTRNKVTAEYALRGVDKPLGIAVYALADALPDEWEGQMPSVEALEKELGVMGRGEDE